MCDLLGLSFDTPLKAQITLDVFQQRGTANPDGWGVAFYSDNKLQVVKEAETSVDSGLFDFLERYPESQTIITHVRRSTRGGRSYLNTHPFYRLLTIDSNKREYAFAHNGTLTQQEKLRFNEFRPIGETDSERAFCHLLDAILDKAILQWNHHDYRYIESLLQEINDGQNTLNCIFSDGKHLFCYSDENDHNSGLRFIKQTYPYHKVELISSNDRLGEIEIGSDSSKESQIGYIVSTRILTKEDWTEFDNGELIVFRQGEIVYPTKRI
jgi:glutamine amidotransferase